MLKKIYAVVLFLLSATAIGFAQDGTLKGKLIDEANGEAISFANIQLEQSGNSIARTIADIDGNFTIKPIPPGKYDLKAVMVGYQTIMIQGVVIGGDKTTYQDLKMKSSAVEMSEVEIIEYAEPLIDPDTKSGGTVTREEFKAMPSKNINSVASTTAGVFQRDENSAVSVRGGRPKEGSMDVDQSSTKYIIDGEKVRGTTGLPQGAIEQVSVITGGIPAQYGDATGGVISITTRGGVRPKYYGGLELISSQFTDAYGLNFAGANVGGPIISKKDSAGNREGKVGFFLSGEVSSEKDPNPSSAGMYKVKDEKLSELKETPLFLSESGKLLTKAEFLRAEDWEHIKARQNVAQNIARINGKIDMKIAKGLTFTVGGSIDYGKYHAFAFDYALLNSENNPEITYNTTRMYARITHTLGKTKTEGDQSTTLFKNAFYTLQVGYTKYTEMQEDDSHKNNLFNYGYVGRFKTHKTQKFKLITDSLGGGHYISSTGNYDTLVTFDPSVSANPEATNYTEQYYDLFPGNPKKLTDISSGLGLLNGDRPFSPYNLWYNTGRQYNQYYNQEQNQKRISGMFSTDIKNHSIQLGFEYEQREDRNWSISPLGLWSLMRSYENVTMNDKDSSVYYGPIVLENGTIVQNPAYTVWQYNYQVETQSQFDKALRDKLQVGNGKWIDIDNLDPTTFSISMFAPDELLNGGVGFGYYGYTYDNRKVSAKEKFTFDALNRFYKDKDDNGNYKRSIPAFQPVYMAGYIQDKFDIKDLKFNIGLRIDYFDAQQPVLKDKYLLTEAFTVGEDKKFQHPTNIRDNYVVYVNKAENPTKVVGYRNGDKWYNENGAEIFNVDAIEKAAGGFVPYLKYPKEKNFLESSETGKIFKMYDPQITYMPRISFSFPISDLANFFAHYDVLTQRPPAYLRFNPISYLSSSTNSTSAPANNPDLKPERTIDYEIGFSQVLNDRKNSSIKLSAFYRDMKDMVQQLVVYKAYPKVYSTFGNIDFGTVKGFTFAYDLRRTNNVQMTASYTLQFAAGTGSATTSSQGIIAGDQPNLRTTMPLDFDQRHAFVLNADYRFGSGKNYSGPKAAWAKVIFENLGGNVVFRLGSGLPYSRQANVSSGNGNGGNQVIFNQNDRTTLKGSINGSNLPWQNRVDLRVDKNIPLKFGKGEERSSEASLNIYVQVLNLLNAKNIMNLYRYTGDPKDDGYLTAPVNQIAIASKNDPTSFADLYDIKLQNPGFYSIPRRIRIGLEFNF
ncbi:MAG TPA: TonB-dependent receptor [Bacteroidia bacterium]|nr:TonB-dependent receptor [Bacteroidia bacterium]